MIRGLLHQALEQLRRELHEDMAATRLAADADDRRRDASIQTLIVDVEELKAKIAEVEDEVRWIADALGGSRASW